MDEISHHRPDSRRSSIQLPKTGPVLRPATIALLYLAIAWAIHAGSINPVTHLIGGGDGFTQGMASKTFATSLSSWNPDVQSGKFVFADVLYQRSPVSIILSAQPNHIIDFSEHLRIQFFSSHSLRLGWLLCVFIPQFTSAEWLFGIRRRPDFHELRIHDGAQRA
jgi:hypothetical protein